MAINETISNDEAQPNDNDEENNFAECLGEIVKKAGKIASDIIDNLEGNDFEPNQADCGSLGHMPLDRMSEEQLENSQQCLEWGLEQNLMTPKPEFNPDFVLPDEDED